MRALISRKKAIQKGTTGVGVLALMIAPRAAMAADITLLGPVGIQALLEPLLASFQRSSGKTIAASYATGGKVAEQIRAGALFDVAVLPGAAFDAVVKAGKIEPASATRVAQALLAVGVRAGAPKPDVSTVDAFKAALLSSSSIAYTDPAAGGAAGIQIGRVIERLGLTDQLKAKTTLLPGATMTETADVVAKGEAQLGLAQQQVFVATPGTQLAGSLPAELQDPANLLFWAGIAAGAHDPAVARALIAFLIAPDSMKAIRSMGLAPG